MEKVIKIDLYNKELFFEKYNENMVSRDLINYLVEQTIFMNRNDKVKVIINDKCDLEETCIILIKKGLEMEYQKNLKICKFTNIKQVALLLLGILLLFLSATFQGLFIFQEIFLIIGWVPIWEAFDIELFSNVKEKKKRSALKKLLVSNFEVIK